MKYCPQCGAPATGTPFCGQCGHAFSSADGGATDRKASTRAAGGLAGAGGANPFAGTARIDYVRDVLALVLLVAALGMAWDGSDHASAKVYVVLATVLSIASLALPYLGRAGALPEAWGSAQLRLARLAANVPYVLVVLVTVVLAYTTSGSAGETTVSVAEVFGREVGVGVMFGLSGALLAAQAREPERDADDARVWRLVLLGLGGLVALTSVVSLVLTLIRFEDGRALLPEFDTAGLAIALYLLMFVFFVVVPGVAVAGMLRGDAGWRDAVVALGLAAVVAGFWQIDAASGGSWPLRLLGPAHLVWPALAVVVTAAALAPVASAPTGAGRWISSARRILQATALVAGLGVVSVAFMLTAVDTGRTGTITVLVLLLLATAAAVVGANAVRREPRSGRRVALVASGVIVVVGIVVAAMSGTAAFATDVHVIVTTSALFVLPLAAAAALTAPRVVRDEFGPLSVPRPTPAPAQSAPVQTAPPQTLRTATTPAAQRPVVQQPVTQRPLVQQPATEQPPATTQLPVVNAPETTPAYDAQVASDPSTPLEVLADIAAKEPSLRPHIAANPSTYPALLEWLGKLGDPAVDEALRGRG